MSKIHTVKEPTSCITVGRLLEPKTLLSLLLKFDTSYEDFCLIKINGKRVKRDYVMVCGGDIVKLYK